MLAIGNDHQSEFRIKIIEETGVDADAAGSRSACYGALMFIDLDNFKPLNDTSDARRVVRYMMRCRNNPRNAR